MPLVRITPYMKAIVAAVIAALTLVAQIINDGNLDANDAITVIGGISTVYGVYKATNTPHPNDTGTIG